MKLAKIGEETGEEARASTMREQMLADLSSPPRKDKADETNRYGSI